MRRVPRGRPDRPLITTDKPRFSSAIFIDEKPTSRYQSGQLPRNPFLTSNVDHRQRTCRLRVLRIEIPPLRVGDSARGSGSSREPLATSITNRIKVEALAIVRTENSTAAIRPRPPIWHLWMTFQCKSNSLARFCPRLALSEGGFSRVGHLDPLRVRRGPWVVVVMPVPPFVGRGLGVTLRRILPNFLTT